MKKTKQSYMVLFVLFVAQSIFAATFQYVPIAEKTSVVTFEKYIKSLKTFFLSYYLEFKELDEFKELEMFFVQNPLDQKFDSLQLPFLYCLEPFKPSESGIEEREVYNYMFDINQSSVASLFSQEVLEMLYLGIVLEFIIREVSSPISSESRFNKFVQKVNAELEQMQSTGRAKCFKEIISYATILVEKKDKFYE